MRSRDNAGMASVTFTRGKTVLLGLSRITFCLFITMQLKRESLYPKAPLHVFGMVALSNTISTTCQYEVSDWRASCLSAGLRAVAPPFTRVRRYPIEVRNFRGATPRL